MKRVVQLMKSTSVVTSDRKEPNQDERSRSSTWKKSSVWKRLGPSTAIASRNKLALNHHKEVSRKPPEFVDLTREDTSEDEARYSPALDDILKYFDPKNKGDTEELDIEDVMTITKSDARKILITNRALDTLTYEEAVLCHP